MSNKSLLIVIEGLDGSGKTTASKLLAKKLKEKGYKVKRSYEPHDPSCGGGYIRAVLTKKIRKFSHRTLALAFAANRLDHRDRVINPWLAKENRVIICDRYYLSSLVYQSKENFGFKEVLKLNEKARKPDIIFFLNVSNEVCYQRMKGRNQAKELFEENLEEDRQKFFNAIQYLKRWNKDNIVEIDASGTPEETVAQMLEKL